MPSLNRIKKNLKIIMARVTRTWHPAFIDYMNFIVNHENYEGMPEPFKEDGTIRWIVTKKSDIGRKRDSWWNMHMKNLGAINKAEVARSLHPKELSGLKPCQICGRKLSIHYAYPTYHTLNRLNKLLDTEYKAFDKTVGEIIQIEYDKRGDAVFQTFDAVFDIAENLAHDADAYCEFVLENRKSRLSPGMMCNPPDRLDGFHTYNACCRSVQDTGRHASNLATYTQDRRAYEYWSEGDFNHANRLMGEYRKNKQLYECPKCKKSKLMTADHIGPISLGFIHRAAFDPLCKSCNSTKNNRLTYQNVKQLIQDESKMKIVSWHSQYLWDLLKNKVTDDSDAIKLSRLMATNLQNVLIILSEIFAKTGETFLSSYLHPEFAFYDYRFENFDPFDLSKINVIKSELQSANKQKNSERYLRVSFEVLEDFARKENRRAKSWNSKEVDQLVEKTIKKIKENKYEEADSALRDAIKTISYLGAKDWT